MDTNIMLMIISLFIQPIEGLMNTEIFTLCVGILLTIFTFGVVRNVTS